MFREFNTPEYREYGGLKCRIDASCLEHFAGNRLAVHFVHALAAERAIKLKEVFESFEFFARVRRRVRAKHMADLCCGHGLTGIVFAMMERQVEQVTLLDTTRPRNHDKVMAAALAVAPWVKDKIRYLEVPVQQAASVLEPDTSLVAVHACGVRTDRCIEAAIELRGPIAVMPCCYQQTGKDAPRGLFRALGRSLSTDVQRTYTLEDAGFDVEWTGIPAEITPMNRVMVAIPRRSAWYPA